MLQASRLHSLPSQPLGDEMKRVLAILDKRMDVVAAKQMETARTFRYTNMLMWEQVLKELVAIREQVAAMEKEDAAAMT